MAFPRKSLTHCAICGYDRTAIPESPRCPECGFPFDEPLRILRTRVVPAWIALSQGILAVAIVEAFLTPSIRWSPFLPTQQLKALVWSILFGAMFVIAIWPLGAVGIGLSGLAIQTPLRRPRWIPFSEIDVQHKARGVYFLREKSGGPLRLPTAGMRWKQRLSIQAEIAHAWAEDHANAGDPATAAEPPPSA